MTRIQAARLAAVRPASTVRVLAWTWSSARALDPSLRRLGMDALDRIRLPPPAPAGLRPLASGLLRAMGVTCLVRSAVLQRWDTAHQRPRPLLIGVARGEDGFKAHAWLEGERGGAGFVELHRRPPA